MNEAEWEVCQPQLLKLRESVAITSASGIQRGIRDSSRSEIMSDLILRGYRALSSQVN